MHKPYKRLKATLLLMDVSYNDLAILIGKSKHTLSNKINGKQDFYLWEAMKIADYLKSDMSIFLQ